IVSLPSSPPVREAGQKPGKEINRKKGCMGNRLLLAFRKMEPTLCGAIILSDTVIREAGTGKLSLIGCFTNWNSSQFPFPVPPFCATALVTNFRGKLEKASITMRIEDPKTGHVLTSVSGAITPPPGQIFEQNEIL